MSKNLDEKFPMGEEEGLPWFAFLIAVSDSLLLSFSCSFFKIELYFYRMVTILI
jgi:hypothetical protein